MKACFASEMRGVDKAANQTAGSCGAGRSAVWD